MSDTKLLAKDLRIGNLHYYRMADDFDDRKEWTEISIIDANDILFLSENPNDENYNPIPLSEDVLIKLGAEKKSTTEFRIGNRLLIYRKFSWWDYGADVELPYTHTLQNFIHSLTGEELIYTEN